MEGLSESCHLGPFTPRMMADNTIKSLVFNNALYLLASRETFVKCIHQENLQSDNQQPPPMATIKVFPPPQSSHRQALRVSWHICPMSLPPTSQTQLVLGTCCQPAAFPPHLMDSNDCRNYKLVISGLTCTSSLHNVKSFKVSVQSGKESNPIYIYQC